jgi:hypothetical protein
VSSVDILLLTLFRSTANKDDKAISILAKVDPIPRPEINSVFVNAGANALGVRQIALLDARQSRSYLGRRLPVQTIGSKAKRAVSVPIKVLAHFDHLRW